jgi:hypothetical protein
MRNLRITICVLGIVVVAVWVGWSVHLSEKHRQIVRLLQHQQLSAARAILNGSHNWDDLLGSIEASKDPALAQAALDVQFEYWYSRADDTNYPYPEHIEIIQRLLALGARPSFGHLLHATQQNKMGSARLFLDAGVPVKQADAAASPLANAAYWGDLELIQLLLRRGSDVNESSTGGWRPILAAAWSCKTECVRHLLDHGADVSLPYEAWAGHVQPIWKVIEERASQGSDYSNIWHIIKARIPAGAVTTPPPANPGSN